MECGEGSRHSRWVERERERRGRKRNKKKRDGSGKEEQVGLKQSPRHGDLCRPAKHSHQSHGKSWKSMSEAAHAPGKESGMQMQKLGGPLGRSAIKHNGDTTVTPAACLCVIEPASVDVRGLTCLSCQHKTTRPRRVCVWHNKQKR